MGKTIIEKIWDRHLVRTAPDEPDLLYVDLHLLHEVTSPQAFEGLRLAGRRVRRPDLTVATMDHNIPTSRFEEPDEVSILQMKTLEDNCAREGVRLYGVGSREQGIVHVIGPELGLTQPGLVIVCGDSHTSTHGAFGALAFGIGTSEVEHVLATQCLVQRRPKLLAITVDGQLPVGVVAKDIALNVIARLGVAGGQGFAVEYRGEAIRALSMEGRMTVCNMTIEGGARAGLVAPDDTTFRYLEGRRFAPKGSGWEAALEHWRSLPSDPDAVFDREEVVDSSVLEPFVTWGTNPGQAVAISARIPDPADEAAERALAYMALKAGTPMADIAVDRVFIGSCTNARLEDLRVAAAIVRGRHVHPSVRAMVVPGSTPVKMAAEAEGLDDVFTEAGFEWRDAGCSMCLGMNPDILAPGERCASTSNRNFEGRQGAGGRTHLVSPAMAAAAAVSGHFVDVRELT